MVKLFGCRSDHHAGPAVALGAALLLGAQGAVAWGAAGHEIIATIAQAHLHPSVKSTLCDILPDEARCHLAPVAAWADVIKGRWRETAGMHYVNPIDDDPSFSCDFGSHGWINEKVNVITAIMNMTTQLRDNPLEGKDIPLRFLVHFMGDLHQPLHLTGKARGGNQALVRWEGRLRSLHSTWDSGVINRNIRNLHNYTSPTSNKALESALLGATFDPYVRFIVQEGINQWWRDDVTQTWATCPADGDPYPTSRLGDKRRSLSRIKMFMKTAKKFALGSWVGPMLWGQISPVLPDFQHFDDQAVRVSQHAREAAMKKERLEPLHGHAKPQSYGQQDQVAFGASAPLGGMNTTYGVFPACPFTWGSGIHPINCKYAWPAGWDPKLPPIELDTPAYAGKWDDDKVVEKLLAMGGIRLAAILNTLFASHEELQASQASKQIYPHIRGGMISL